MLYQESAFTVILQECGCSTRTQPQILEGLPKYIRLEAGETTQGNLNCLATPGLYVGSDALQRLIIRPHPNPSHFFKKNGNHYLPHFTGRCIEAQRC